LPPSQFETCFLSLAHGNQETEGVLSAFAEVLEGYR
jgi:glutamate-1-semialdehyde aminotransferase